PRRLENPSITRDDFSKRCSRRGCLGRIGATAEEYCMPRDAALVLLIFVGWQNELPAAEPPRDLRDIPCDLSVPQMTTDAPAPGRRVKQQLPEFADSELFHALYLPTNWERGKKYPVIFEYPGNGPFRNKLGDTNSGRLEDCNLGYGISAGKDFI